MENIENYEQQNDDRPKGSPYEKVELNFPVDQDKKNADQFLEEELGLEQRFSNTAEKKISDILENSNIKYERDKKNPGNPERERWQIISKNLSEGKYVLALSGLLDYFFGNDNVSKLGLTDGLNRYVDKIELNETDIKLLKKKIMEKGSIHAKIDLCSYLSHQLDLMLESKNGVLTQLGKLENHAKEGLYGVGDVILFDSSSIAKLGEIKDSILRNGTSYTHCGIVTNIDPLRMTHAISGGVAEISVSEYLGNHNSNKVIVTKGGGATVANKAKSQIGKPYDYKGMIDEFGNNRRSGDGSSFYCSELVFDSLSENDKNLVTPDDLLKISYPLYMSK